MSGDSESLSEEQLARREAARALGRIRSERKAAAVRANGRKNVGNPQRRVRGEFDRCTICGRRAQYGRNVAILDNGAMVCTLCGRGIKTEPRHWWLIVKE